MTDENTDGAGGGAFESARRSGIPPRGRDEARMVAASPASRHERLTGAVVVAMAVVGTPILFLQDPSVPGFYPSCPTRLIWPDFACPGCGSLRMLHNLFHLRLERSFAFNPLSLLCVPLMIWFVLDGLLTAVRGRGLARARLSHVASMSIFFALVGYTLLRNVPWGITPP